MSRKSRGSERPRETGPKSETNDPTLASVPKIKKIGVVGDVTEDILLFNDPNKRKSRSNPSEISKSLGGAFFVSRMLEESLKTETVEVSGYTSSAARNLNLLQATWNVERFYLDKKRKKPVLRCTDTLRSALHVGRNPSGKQPKAPTHKGLESEEKFQMLVIQDLKLPTTPEGKEDNRGFLTRDFQDNKDKREWERAFERLEPSHNDKQFPQIFVMVNRGLPELAGSYWTHLLPKSSSDNSEDKVKYDALVKKNYKEKTLAIIYANTLRVEGLAITQGLSWERTAQDFLAELYTNPIMQKLGDLQHLIVRFGVSGAIYSYRVGEDRRFHRLFFDPKAQKIGFYREIATDGDVIGNQSIFLTSIIKELAPFLNENTVGCEGQPPGSVNPRHFNGYGIVETIGKGIRKAIRRCQYHFDKGFGDDIDKIQTFMEEDGYDKGLFQPLPSFTTDDVKYSERFAKKLSDAKDPVSVHLRGLLTPDTEKQVKEGKADSELPFESPETLHRDLNRLLRHDSLYEKACFKGTQLRKSTSEFTNDPLQDGDLLSFNRLLLEDAYPDEIKKTKSSTRILKFHQIANERIPTGNPSWSILNQSAEYNLLDVAIKIVLQGDWTALNNKRWGSQPTVWAPIVRFGKPRDQSPLVIIDRREIESYRAVHALLSKALQGKEKRPLSIGVFGPPGSGKSTVVKKLVESAGGHDLLLRNVAQWTDEKFFRAEIKEIERKKGKQIVFFDEFDCDLKGTELGWLKYFLHYMENWKKPPYPIFVFAGGTSLTYRDFAKENLSIEDAKKVAFAKAKGPDFASRLRGHINILGPNPVDEYDAAYVVRRAVYLRDLLFEMLEKNKEGDVNGKSEDLEDRTDKAIVAAMLTVPSYKHGMRSMRAILDMCKRLGDGSGNEGRFVSSVLPSAAQLDMHVDGKEFLDRIGEFRKLYGRSCRACSAAKVD